MLYLVIIGDIIKSRELSNRYKVQQEFSSAVHETQQTYGERLISPITLTIGDEFQSVMQNGRGLFKIVDDLDLKMRPIQLRYGIGIGNINTAINSEISIGMDGPAFHMARDALEVCKKNEIRYNFRYKNHDMEQRINILLSWIDASTKNWSDEKRNILSYKEKNYTQMKIAQLTEMSQPAVSQHLKSPYFDLIRRTRYMIEEELQKILKGPQ